MAYKMDKTLSNGAFDFIDAPGIAKLLSQKKEDKFLIISLKKTYSY